MADEVRYHVNPETGLPNLCNAGKACRFGGDDFHYPNKHDAQVAWKARQLERGIIAYRNVMRATEKDEENAAIARWAGKTKGFSKKISWGVLRSVIIRNLSRYVINFMGIFIAYAIASGKWLTDDWIRRLLPTLASIVLVGLLVWFGIKFWKGSRRAAVGLRERRIRKTIRKDATTPAASP